MKTRKLNTERSLIKCFFLSLITLGMYEFWFIHCLAKDVNTVCYRDNKKTSGLLIYIILSILTLGIYKVFWWYRVAHLINAEQRREKMNNPISPGLILVCDLLNYITILIKFHYICKAMNDICYNYNYKIDNPDLA